VSRYTIPQHRTRNLSSDSEDDTDNSSSAFESKDQDPLSDPVITFTVEKEVNVEGSLDVLSCKIDRGAVREFLRQEVISVCVGGVC
jgi:hypothetical protein